MGGNQKKDSGLHLGDSVIPGKRLTAGAVLSLVILIGSILLSTSGAVNGLLAGMLLVAGAGVGILFQPRPKPEDHSDMAAAAVERIYRMGNDLTQVQETVTELAGLSTDPAASQRLITAQNELLDQIQQLEQTVSDFNTLSPGVAERVRFKLDEGKRLFAHLSGGK